MRHHRVSFKPLHDDAKIFLSRSTGIDFWDANFKDKDTWVCCSVYDGEVPITVIVFEMKSPFDAHFTLAVADPRGLTRQLICNIYRRVFQKACRVTALVEPHNHIAMRQVWRMGFKQEGYLRRGYNGIDDAVVWGLLPEDCPYLTGTPFRFRPLVQTHEAAHRIQ